MVEKEAKGLDAWRSLFLSEVNRVRAAMAPSKAHTQSSLAPIQADEKSRIGICEGRKSFEKRR